MHEYIETLREAKMFTMLKAYSGYWHVYARTNDRLETVSVCRPCPCQNVRVPFELTDAPPTFQLASNITLSKFMWQACHIYLEDVVILWKDVESHVVHIHEVLSSLKRAGVALIVKKFMLFISKVEHPRHMIRPSRLAMNGANTK